MGEFPNKKTQFTSENQPKNKGIKKGSIHSKTILNKFLEMEIEQINPFTKVMEKMTVAELMNLVQIKNALDGELPSFREIYDRLEGKPKQEINQTNYNIDEKDLNDAEIKRIKKSLNDTY